MPDSEASVKPVQPQEIWGVPRHCLLPLCAFLGGALIFLIVDILCLLLNHAAGHPAGVEFIRDMPK